MRNRCTMKKYAIMGLLLLTGCRNEYQFEQPFAQSSVMPKPILALLPVMDHAKHHLSWDVSKILTLGIHHSLAKEDRLYLIDQERMLKAVKELPENQNPFGENITWIKKKFREEEFVAFVELAEHLETPLNFQNELPNSECPAELFMSARIKVFDLREAAPKIILSETLTHSENIPKQFTQANLKEPLLPDQEGFEATPQGIAHDLFAKKIAARIEDYILLTQKNQD